LGRPGKVGLGGEKQLAKKKRLLSLGIRQGEKKGVKSKGRHDLGAAKSQERETDIK